METPNSTQNPTLHSGQDNCGSKTNSVSSKAENVESRELPQYYVTLCISRIPGWIVDEDLEEGLLTEFEKYGRVSLRLVKKDGDRYAYVRFAHAHDAEEAFKSTVQYPLLLGDEKVDVVPYVQEQKKAVVSSKYISSVPTHVLFVGNLPSDISTPQLKDVFKVYGLIEDIDLKPAKVGKKAFAFIQFSDISSVIQANAECYNINIGGKQCKTGYGQISDKWKTLRISHIPYHLSISQIITAIWRTFRGLGPNEIYVKPPVRGETLNYNTVFVNFRDHKAVKAAFELRYNLSLGGQIVTIVPKHEAKYELFPWHCDLADVVEKGRSAKEVKPKSVNSTREANSEMVELKRVADSNLRYDDVSDEEEEGNARTPKPSAQLEGISDKPRAQADPVEGREERIEVVEPKLEENASSNLFVGNLPSGITEEEVRTWFDKYGQIESIVIKRPLNNRAYAFVKYISMDSAHTAKVEMNGQTFRDHQLKISYSKSQTTSCLWVGGLGPWVDDALLRKEFKRFGEIKTFVWSKGNNFAYIHYEDETAAQAACHTLQLCPLGGKTKQLRIDFVSDKQILALIGESKKTNAEDDSVTSVEPTTGSAGNEDKSKADKEKALEAASALSDISDQSFISFVSSGSMKSEKAAPVLHSPSPDSINSKTSFISVVSTEHSITSLARCVKSSSDSHSELAGREPSLSSDSDIWAPFSPVNESLERHSKRSSEKRKRESHHSTHKRRLYRTDSPLFKRVGGYREDYERTRHDKSYAGRTRSKSHTSKGSDSHRLYSLELTRSSRSRQRAYSCRSSDSSYKHESRERSPRYSDDKAVWDYRHGTTSRSLVQRRYSPERKSHYDHRSSGSSYKHDSREWSPRYAGNRQRDTVAQHGPGLATSYPAVRETMNSPWPFQSYPTEQVAGPQHPGTFQRPMQFGNNYGSFPAAVSSDRNAMGSYPNSVSGGGPSAWPNPVVQGNMPVGISNPSNYGVRPPFSHQSNPNCNVNMGNVPRPINPVQSPPFTAGNFPQCVPNQHSGFPPPNVSINNSNPRGFLGNVPTPMNPVQTPPFPAGPFPRGVDSRPNLCATSQAMQRFPPPQFLFNQSSVSNMRPAAVNPPQPVTRQPQRRILTPVRPTVLPSHIQR